MDPHGITCLARAPLFMPFFALVFRPAFQHEASLENLRTETQNSNKSSKSANKSSSERTQPRAAKRLRLGGVKPWKLTTLQHFHLFSQRPRGLKVKPKRKPKSRLRAPKQTSAKRALSQTVKNKTTKNWSESQFGCQKKLFFSVFMVPF